MKILEVFPDDGFWRARTEDGKVSVLAQSLPDAIQRAKEAIRYLADEDRATAYTLVLKADTD